MHFYRLNRRIRKEDYALLLQCFFQSFTNRCCLLRIGQDASGIFFVGRDPEGKEKLPHFFRREGMK